MKVVIDIPEDMYNDADILIVKDFPVIKKAIINGTPYEERPTGEWHGNNFDEHSCTICGHPALYKEEPDGYYEVTSNFCPNCGASMMRGDT